MVENDGEGDGSSVLRFAGSVATCASSSELSMGEVVGLEVGPSVGMELRLGSVGEIVGFTTSCLKVGLSVGENDGESVGSSVFGLALPPPATFAYTLSVTSVCL